MLSETVFDPFADKNAQREGTKLLLNIRVCVKGGRALRKGRASAF